MMSIKFSGTYRPRRGKRADVEVHFLDGDLAGLRLCGFSVWMDEDGYSVRFPGRMYKVNGEQQLLTFLRPISREPNAHLPLSQEILDAYGEWVRASGRG